MEELKNSRETLLRTGLLSIEAHYRVPLVVNGYQKELKEVLLKFYEEKIQEVEKAMQAI